MFKSIPGNKKYIISLSQEFRDIDGYPVNVPKAEEGRVIVEMYGKEREVCPRWLSLISHFEMYLPDPTFSKLLNINFVQDNIRFFNPRASSFPMFSKPVEFEHEGKAFRLISNYSMYAVSKEGEVIRVRDKEPIKVLMPRKENPTNEGQYPSVRIYEPDKSNYRYVYVHRLVGIAWVRHPNNDFVTMCLINHKDGNKLNYKSGNLEWCSFRHNSLHAYAAGLREDNIRCRIKDFKTGEVIEFPSKSQAAEYMGCGKSILNENNLRIRSSRFIKDRYEFKVSGDDSPLVRNDL